MDARMLIGPFKELGNHIRVRKIRKLFIESEIRDPMSIRIVTELAVLGTGELNQESFGFLDG